MHDKLIEVTYYFLQIVFDSGLRNYTTWWNKLIVVYYIDFDTYISRLRKFLRMKIFRFPTRYWFFISIISMFLIRHIFFQHRHTYTCIRVKNKDNVFLFCSGICFQRNTLYLLEKPWRWFLVTEFGKKLKT